MKIISLCTQKGGVGKTTTVHHIASAIKKWWPHINILSIDLDPQANLTTVSGVDKAGFTWLDYLDGKCSAIDTIKSTSYMGDIVPCNAEFVDIEAMLLRSNRREYKLKGFLEEIQSLRQYHFVLIDCQASFGMSTINALIASDKVYSPLQMEPYAVDGIETFFDYASLLKDDYDLELEVGGIIRTMVNPRLKLTKSLQEVLEKRYPKSFLETQIRRTVDLAQCSEAGISVYDWEPDSNGSEDYKNLTEEILKREELV